MVKSIEEMNPRFLEMARRSGNPNLKPKPLEETIKQDIQELQGYIYVPSINLYVAKERSHFNLNWHQAHEALHKEDSRMLTLREFVDFLKLLRNGNHEFRSIYNEIAEARDSWRGEWLDAYFEQKNNQLHILTKNKTKSELLEDYLMEDRRINLDYWLDNATKQGLPPRNIPDGDLWYWYPRNESVARFSAYFYGAYLDCDKGPIDSDSSLRVRACKRTK